MQPACPHKQSMSGVFSMAAHSVLQYLPDVARHEQAGCAHFSVFIGVIWSLPVSKQQQLICGGMLDVAQEVCLHGKKHICRIIEFCRS